MERRLTTILAADVAGYSRLMNADEEHVTKRLARLREILFSRIAEADGKVFGEAGDGFIAEFASPVKAVRCGVRVQRDLALENCDILPDRKMLLRIGIHLADVVVDQDTLLGDGVNIAARIEAGGQPGEVHVSGQIFDQVAKSSGLSFACLGPKSLKNIEGTVTVYAVAGESQIERLSDSQRQEEATPSPPDKPALAVLPFTNMSGDPEQEFFADGITEDVITELSRFRGLVVISRTSAFMYKGKAVNLQNVAKDLGVRYLVEGSVRKAGKRVRVTAQLIDATSNSHLWAERYDRDLDDIFAVQDEITSTIASILPGRIEAANQERIQRQLPDNMAAYECVLAGKILHHRSDINDNERAQALLSRAIELDPNYAHAHSWRACVLAQSWVHGWCENRTAIWDEIKAELQIALALDDNDSGVHRILAAVNVAHSDLDKAMYHQERALALNPNDDLIVVQQGEILTWLGQPEDGIEWIQKAMRLNPYHPERFWSHLGRAYFDAHLYSEAVQAFKHLSEPDRTQTALLAACHAQGDDPEQARHYARHLIAQDPDFSVATYLEELHYSHESDREHHRESLLKAGLSS